MQLESPKLSHSAQARINGAKSKRRKTTEGRATASFGRNRTIYGPNANLVSRERLDMWDEIQQRYFYHFNPASTFANNIVNDLVQFELERVKASITRSLDLAIQATEAEPLPTELPHHAQTRLATQNRDLR